MSQAFPVTDDPRFRILVASEGQTSFSVAFPWQDNADIDIWRTGLDGATFVLQEGEHYTLTGAGEVGGGTFILLEGFEATAGETFLVKGDAQLVRVSSVAQAGRFRSQGMDGDLDRMVLIAQEIYRELGRTLRVALGELQPELTIGENNQIPIWLNGNLVPGPEWGDVIGTPGPGVPAGGTTRQFLVKATNASYDTSWTTLFTGSLADNALARFDGTTGVLQSSLVAVNDNGGIAASHNITTSTAGATPSSPRIIGMSGFAPGEAGRVRFGDDFTSLQVANGGKMQLQAYHGVEIIGGRASGTALDADVTGAGSGDVGLMVRIDSANLAQVVMALKAQASHTGDLLQGLSSAGAVLFRVASDGRPKMGSDEIPYRLQGTATYNPPSLGDGAGDTTTVTVTGAALGDIAIASFSLATSGITITAWVSAANTVSVRFQNESGGILDIGSGTLKAWVLK